MRQVQGVEFKEGSQEELLPGFGAAFPYIATCAQMDQYREPMAPWHWHRTVELFYMRSGTLEYTTPGGNRCFLKGPGDL